MIAFVFEVIFSSIRSTSMLYVFGLMSTNTTCAPAILMASDVAMKLLATVMTSSPAPTPSVFSAMNKRVGSVRHADAVLDATVARERLLERLDVAGRR